MTFLSFQSLLPFIPFSCLIIYGKNLSIMLNRSSDCRDPCVIPVLKGKTSSILPLDMSAVDYISYQFTEVLFTVY